MIIDAYIADHQIPIEIPDDATVTDVVVIVRHQGVDDIGHKSGVAYDSTAMPVYQVRGMLDTAEIMSREEVKRSFQ